MDRPDAPPETNSYFHFEFYRYNSSSRSFDLGVHKLHINILRECQLTQIFDHHLIKLVVWLHYDSWLRYFSLINFVKQSEVLKERYLALRIAHTKFV